MKKTLILGASGNLGSQISIAFEDNYQIIPLNRQNIDLLEISKLAALLEQIKPSIIINTAAYNQVDNCEKSSQEYAKALFLNQRLPAFLADWCLERGSLLVHYSSDYVFQSDSLKDPGFSETAEVNPINKYGLSKALGEKSILTLANKGLAFYIIRTSKLFGPKGLSVNAKPSFFDIMLNLSQTKKIIEVVNSERSCFTYTPDLAQASLELINDQAKYGIYHLVNEEPCTWYQAIKFLFNHLKIEDIKIEAVNNLKRAATRPTSSILLNTKRKKLRSYKKALMEYYKK
jgi:dTDP-4-dehydrorhamnose reductase